MCEIAVFVTDQVNDDFYMNCQCFKAGDVVEVLPDGWPWGKLDLANPNWRIFKFPGMPVSAFTQFMSAQIAGDPLNPSKTLLKRAVQFDFNALKALPIVDAAKVDAFLIDDKGGQTQVILTLTPADVAKIAVMKPDVQDPAIIGIKQQTNVIG